MNNVDISEIIATIAEYNGYTDWLMDMVSELEKAEGTYSGGVSLEEWHTDKHAIWMILVQLFGDWGTSVRSGWIQDTKECAEFIRHMFDETIE